MVLKGSYLQTIDDNVAHWRKVIDHARNVINNARIEIGTLQDLRAGIEQLERSELRGRGARAFVMPELIPGPATSQAVEEPPDGSITIRRRTAHLTAPRDYRAEHAKRKELAARQPRSDRGKPKGSFAEIRAARAEAVEEVLAVFREQPVMYPSEVIDRLNLRGDKPRVNRVYNIMIALKKEGRLSQSQVGEPYALVEGGHAATG